MPAVAETSRRRGQPVTRDLTQTFKKTRKAKHLKQQQKHGRGYPGTEALIGPDGEPADRGSSRSNEGKCLPPQWVDCSDKAREELREIRMQLVALTKAHQKRLLKAEAGLNFGSDKEIQALSGSIATQIRCCEQSIHQVRNFRCETDDAELNMGEEMRQNVQRSLASELQDLSQQVRQKQKEYLKEVKRRQQQSADLEAGNASSSTAIVRHSGKAKAASSGGMRGGGQIMTQQQSQMVSQQQISDLDDMESTAAMRSAEIASIAASISELHAIFKDLAILVIDQGSILDRIDYNTEKTYTKSQDAKGQMQKAVAKKKSNDSRIVKCFALWVGLDILMLILLLVKYQIKYGLANVFWFLCIVSALIGGCYLYARFRKPEALNMNFWEKVTPDFYGGAKALWKKVRPNPVAAAKAAHASGGIGGLRGAAAAMRG